MIEQTVNHAAFKRDIRGQNVDLLNASFKQLLIQTVEKKSGKNENKSTGDEKEVWYDEGK